jgi:hypothetical protein
MKPKNLIQSVLDEETGEMFYVNPKYANDTMSLEERVEQVVRLQEDKRIDGNAITILVYCLLDWPNRGASATDIANATGWRHRVITMAAAVLEAAGYAFPIDAQRGNVETQWTFRGDPSHYRPLTQEHECSRRSLNYLRLK